MKKVKCKNCGASFDDSLAQCPYCGTMNKKGAYGEFRKKISSMIDSFLGLKDEVHRSVSSIILRSLFKSLLLVVLTAALAFICSRFVNVNYYNDKEYDQEAMENITWLDDNLDRLNAAYEAEDYKSVEKIYYENTKAASGWVLYPTYCLKKECKELETSVYFGAGQLQQAMYLLFYPGYYTGYGGMNRVSDDDYDEICGSVMAFMEEKGYSYSELEEIYSKCKDSYGYIKFDQLKEYVKEAGNGKL